jgi:hypothetical protein
MTSTVNHDAANKVIINNFVRSLHRYKNNCGGLPLSLKEFDKKAIVKCNGNITSNSIQMNDSWGMPLIIILRKNADMEIISTGPDKKFASYDDVIATISENWDVEILPAKSPTHFSCFGIFFLISIVAVTLSIKYGNLLKPPIKKL